MFKNIVKTLTVIAAISFTSISFAATTCGAGKIIDIKEGGWNSNGLAIQLTGPDSTTGDSTKKPGTGTRLFVYFNANLGSNKIDAIRRLAAMAFAMNADVWTNSHNNNCSAATELSILK